MKHLNLFFLLTITDFMVGLATAIHMQFLVNIDMYILNTSLWKPSMPLNFSSKKTSALARIACYMRWAYSYCLQVFF